MSDPLSTSGSVVGIISLGIQVAQFLHKYYNDVKDQPSDTRRTLKKLDKLQHLLGNLKSDLESKPPDEELVEEVVEAVEACNESVQELQQVVEKFKETSSSGLRAAARATGRRLAYPFRLSTLQKLDEDIDDAISHLSLALSMLQQKAIDRVENDVEDIKAVLATVETMLVSSYIRDWLKAPNAVLNFNDACSRKHPGTGMWFVTGDAFKNWLEKPRSFLWLRGFAGCGKTILSSTAIQYARRHLRSNPDFGICFFYFTFNDENKQDASAMLRALILQLSNQLKGASAALETWHQTHRDGPPPVTGLLDCLRKIVGMFREVYVVLDALDESPRKTHRRAVLNAINTMRSWPELHLIVTSRDETDISDRLHATPDETIAMKNDNVDKDIAIFVSERLRNDIDLQKLHMYHERIEKTLSERAHGVFRWVECQFIELSQCPRSEFLVEQQLNSLPETLDETYARMLRNIPSVAKEHAQQMLAILCCAARPLTVPELVDALAVDVINSLKIGDTPRFDRSRRLQDVDSLLQICPGFTETVPDAWTKVTTIRIAHFSVQEYLESNRIADHRGASSYAVKIENAHTLMASICLTVLLEDALPTLKVADIKKQYPLAEYAAEEWPKHFKSGTGDRQVNRQLIELFKNTKGALTASIGIWNVEMNHSPNPHEHGVHPSISGVPTSLYYACLLGLYSVVEVLCSDICVVDNMLNAQSGKHGTPLQAAATRGQDDVVELLLRNGANANVKFTIISAGTWDDPTYGSPLIAASAKGHLKVVELLLDAGARVDTMVNGETALLAAIRHHQLDVFRTLAFRGAHTDVKELDEAAKCGNLGALTLILGTGVGPSKHEDAGLLEFILGSALLRACSSGNKEVVELLLSHGTDINIPCGKLHPIYGETVWEAAKGDSEAKNGVRQLLVTHFIENVLGTETGHHESPHFAWCLLTATKIGCQQAVQSLLREAVDTARYDEMWTRSLQEASSCGHHDIVDMLLDGGTLDASKRNPSSATRGIDVGVSLQLASRNGSTRTVRLLLRRGADPNGPEAAGLHRRSELARAYLDIAMQEASCGGHLELVKLLLEHGASVNGPTRYPNTTPTWGDIGPAIWGAAARGHLDIVNFLLENGADPELGHKSWGTPLQAASAKGEVAIMEALLKRGVDVNAEGGVSGSAIAAASSHGSLQAVKVLLAHGAKVNNSPGAPHTTALQLASHRGSEQIVRLLLQHGADVNDFRTDKYRRKGPALLEASEAGHLSIVSLLIDHGAILSPGNPVIGYPSALYAASRSENAAIVQLLLEKTLSSVTAVDMPDEEEPPAIYYAAKHGLKELVQLFLDNGASAKETNKMWRFPSLLSAASYGGDLHVVGMLLAHGADHNLTGSFNLGENEPLYLASEKGSLEIVKLLLKYGIKPRSRRCRKMPLQIAAKNGHVEVLRLLLNERVDKDVGGKGEYKALQLATGNGHKDVMMLLLDEGFGINGLSGSYGSSLQIAAKMGRRDLVELLVEKGADVNATHREHGTALQAAAQAGGHGDLV